MLAFRKIGSAVNLDVVFASRNEPATKGLRLHERSDSRLHRHVHNTNAYLSCVELSRGLCSSSVALNIGLSQVNCRGAPSSFEKLGRHAKRLLSMDANKKREDISTH
jgi:hypothetical protein